MGKRTLSKKIGTSEEEAQELMDGFKKSYPKLNQFMKKTIADAETNGFCKTHFGRRRQVANGRIALNTTIQVIIQVKVVDTINL